MQKKYFEINVDKYVEGKNFSVYRPSSLGNPKDNSVMFIMEAYVDKYAKNFEKVNECLVFWPESVPVPQSIADKHAVVLRENTHLSYCKFYEENDINNYPKKEKVDFTDGYFISPEAKVGEGTVIMPGVYIGGDVVIGKNCYIGAGTKIVGEVTIGDDFVIRENGVIGSDSITTDRDENGKAVTMPQFGGVVIGDNVRAASNVVICRGAIDDTVIGSGTRIGDCNLISHNNVIGEDCFIIGSVMTFGSVTVGKNCMLSGNSSIRNGVTIGDNTIVGLGAVVVKDIPANSVVKGNPAK